MAGGLCTQGLVDGGGHGSPIELERRPLGRQAPQDILGQRRPTRLILWPARRLSRLAPHRAAHDQTCVFRCMTRVEGIRAGSADGVDQARHGQEGVDLAAKVEEGAAVTKHLHRDARPSSGARHDADDVADILAEAPLGSERPQSVQGVHQA